MRKIRPPAPGERPGWERLYRIYADFHKVQTSSDKLAALFDWLMDPAHPCDSVMAVAGDGGLAALAHYRAMPSPLKETEVVSLDDMFVDPYRRGDGKVEALLKRVDEIAAKRAWGLVRWVTCDNNYRARGLYNRPSQRSDWITFLMTAEKTGREVK